MAIVIVVEDKGPDRDIMAKRLRQAGYEVIEFGSVAKGPDRAERLIREVVSWFFDNPDQHVDFLVLDIGYWQLALGGVMLHRTLVETGMRRRFGHVMIPTIYYENASTFNEGAVRAFALSSWIPKENFFKKNAGWHGIDDMIDRMKELENTEPEAWSKYVSF